VLRAVADLLYPVLSRHEAENIYFWFAVAHTCSELQTRQLKRHKHFPLYVMVCTYMCIILGDTLTAIVLHKTPSWLESPGRFWSCVVVVILVLSLDLYKLWHFTSWKLISDLFVNVGGALSMRAAFTVGLSATQSVFGAIIVGVLKNSRSNALNFELYFQGEKMSQFATLRRAVICCVMFSIGDLFGVNERVLIVLTCFTNVGLAWAKTLLPDFDSLSLLNYVLDALVTKPVTVVVQTTTTTPNKTKKDKKE